MDRCLIPKTQQHRQYIHAHIHTASELVATVTWVARTVGGPQLKRYHMPRWRLPGHQFDHLHKRTETCSCCSSKVSKHLTSKSTYVTIKHMFPK